MKDTKIKTWLKAFRLRTLPLSLSGIITGSALAYAVGKFDSILFTLAILTVLFLQILSNLANDLGDGLKGTDNADRVGPMRAIQSGAIPVKAMKKAVILFAFLSLIAGLPLAYLGTKNLSQEMLYVFIGLAIACVVAAMSYTLGKKAYGYHGLGDVFVFFFFGILSVSGIFLLMTKQWMPVVLLPASTIGLLSVAVLNLNNMRDITNDKASSKNTLVVRMGFANAKIYHFFLISLPAVLILLFSWQVLSFGYLFALSIYIVLIPHLIRVLKCSEPHTLDPELKKVALTTFLFAILISIWVWI